MRPSYHAKSRCFGGSLHKGRFLPCGGGCLPVHSAYGDFSFGKIYMIDLPSHHSLPQHPTPFHESTVLFEPSFIHSQVCQDKPSMRDSIREGLPSKPLVGIAGHVSNERAEAKRYLGSHFYDKGPCRRKAGSKTGCFMCSKVWHPDIIFKIKMFA